MAELQQGSQFLQNWQIAQDFEPKRHLMKFRGMDYLNVQNRMIWFIKDQRAMIAAGLAQMPYTVKTELIEIDRSEGYAHFKTYVRDVLGNEATMYGSESARDFPDYAEKASTKSLGRALAMLGYGTQFTAEMDEGNRVVDAPIEGRSQRPAAATTRPEPAPVAQPRQTNGSRPVAAQQRSERPAGATASTADPMATDRQMISIRKLCVALGRPDPDVSSLTFAAARDMLTQLSQAYSESRQAS